MSAIIRSRLTIDFLFVLFTCDFSQLYLVDFDLGRPLAVFTSNIVMLLRLGLKFKGKCKNSPFLLRIVQK